MSARDDLIELLADYPNSISREGAEQFLDAYRAEVLREAASELAAQADDLWAPGSTQHTVMHADADELRRIAADCKTPAAATSPATTATSTQSGGAS